VTVIENIYQIKKTTKSDLQVWASSLLTGGTGDDLDKDSE